MSSSCFQWLVAGENKSVSPTRSCNLYSGRYQSALLEVMLVILKLTISYWCALYGFIFLGRSYTELNHYDDDIWAKNQVYSLSLIFKLWSKPMYRSSSLQQDMLDNLKNVAIPGILQSLFFQ